MEEEKVCFFVYFSNSVMEKILLNQVFLLKEFELQPENNYYFLDLEQIIHLQGKPEPFTPGEPLFWDDPYISQQMLSAHINPNNDLASRRPEKIDRSVNWLINQMNLNPQSAILDLGCGPGLYATQFAKKGIHVTGVDYSKRSIEYARQVAQEEKLEITYRYQNYLELNDEKRYDAALLIYGDFCPLSPEQRGQLLQNIKHALKPGGFFVLDVTTPHHRKKHGVKNGWYAADNGFWKPGPHLVLDEGFDYPEQDIYLDQATVVEPNNKISVYRNWFQDYTRERITKELESGGFQVESVWNDLMGTPYTEDTDWIGIVTQVEK